MILYTMEENTKHKLGIIAYGSLIEEPGDELGKYITGKLECYTPFNVEYGRLSKTRSLAPTLIPCKDGGGPVKAKILVLADDLAIDDARSMLWRRETRIKDRPYIAPAVPGKNAVLVKTIKGFENFETVLYTSIASNIEGDITAARLAEFAIASIRGEAGISGKDGVRYLSGAIENGIITPLTEDYVGQILAITQTDTLAQAIEKLDRQCINKWFDKYLEKDGTDHLAIASLINAAPDVKKKMEIYAGYYGLLKRGGRLFTRDEQGREAARIFCNCTTCQKDDPGYKEKYESYEPLLRLEFEELRNLTASSMAYIDKLRVWDAIFDGSCNLRFSFSGEELELSLKAANPDEIRVTNEFYYEKMVDRYCRNRSAIPAHYQQDFATRREQYIQSYARALYKGEFKSKAVSALRTDQRKLRGHTAENFFNTLVDGGTIDYSSELISYQDMFSLMAGTEDYLYLKFIEAYSDEPATGGPAGGISTERSVLPIHFEDRSGTEFERLVFAYLRKVNPWDTLEWLGQSGDDGGRDIWGVRSGTTYCYQCANYRVLPLKKVTDDIDKLVRGGTVPDNFVVVCGGKASARKRDSIRTYAARNGFTSVEVWSGAEFEELVRAHPELLSRFVWGSDPVTDVVRINGTGNSGVNGHTRMSTGA